MKQSELGNSGILVSGLALGTWAYSGANVWGPSDDREAIEDLSSVEPQYKVHGLSSWLLH